MRGDYPVPDSMRDFWASPSPDDGTRSKNGDDDDGDKDKKEEKEEKREE